MLGDRLTFAIADVDDLQTRNIETLIGTAGITRIEDLGTILTPSTEMEAILKGLDRGEGRTWILNNSGHVLALAGNLSSEPGSEQISQGQDDAFLKRLLHTFYSLILPQPVDTFTDDLSGASRLDSAEILSALSGKADVRWRKTANQQVAILSAAQPVWSNGNVIGAVVVEQTSNRLVTLQNKAMITLMNMTLLVFIVATLFLITFATSLSNRIRRLHSEAEGAIAKDGRIKGVITASTDRDEIGDLSRSFSELMERLEGYTHYLESMSSKLSHEIRTPLAVVKSSIENLESFDLPEESLAYTQRARDGIDRLNRIITNMNEATRLEQALQTTDRDRFALSTLVESCVEGYRLAYPGQAFVFHSTAENTEVIANPDLIAQMLDKLVDNAVDFSATDTAISINILSGKNITLEVSNTGPLLPDEMQSNLFDSLVSLREKRSDDSHLGLGLYIVRLITQYHQGTVKAENRKSGDGVVFSITLPHAD
jgi:dedicated sortase system histidine kinase